MLFQVATALTYVHARQLVHRDVSARNCLVRASPLTVKLADFGLARETEESLYEQSTNTNIPVRERVSCAHTSLLLLFLSLYSILI